MGEQTAASPAQLEDPPSGDAAGGSDSQLIGAAQLIYAEKRTALSLLRTGISVLALPLAVVSALIATSKLYNTSDVPHLFIPVMALNGLLVLLGAYLIARSMRKLRREDRLLAQLKKNHPSIAPYFD